MVGDGRVGVRSTLWNWKKRFRITATNQRPTAGNGSAMVAAVGTRRHIYLARRGLCPRYGDLFHVEGSCDCTTLSSFIKIESYYQSYVNSVPRVMQYKTY